MLSAPETSEAKTGCLALGSMFQMSLCRNRNMRRHRELPDWRRQDSSQWFWAREGLDFLCKQKEELSFWKWRAKTHLCSNKYSLFKKWWILLVIHFKYSRTYCVAHGSCSMLCASLGGRGLGGEWIHVYEALSPFTVHLKLPPHCSLAIPRYKMFLVSIKIKKKIF